MGSSMRNPTWPRPETSTLRKNASPFLKRPPGVRWYDKDGWCVRDGPAYNARMHERICEVGVELFGSYLRRIETCVARLSEEQVWWRSNRATNSVGNLLLHLQGNLSQWVLAGLGGASYERHRSQEFAADRVQAKAELVAGLRGVVERCQWVLRGLDADSLAAQRSIQGYDVDGVYVLLHAVEHMSYHTGQIVHVTKELLGPEGRIDFFPQHHGE